jgi:diacylglycerol kinase (ATP)
VKRRLQSFVHAFHGGRHLLATQPNARIHLAATLLVVGAGLWFSVTHSEWLALALAIGMVWAAEALNTAIELLGDEITLEKRPRIGQAKDVAAFAVLVTAITAAVVAGLVFWKYVGGVGPKVGV